MTVLTWINIAAVALTGLMLRSTPGGQRLEFAAGSSLCMLIATATVATVMLIVGPKEHQLEAVVTAAAWLITACVLLRAYAVQSGAHKTFAQMRDE